MMMIVMMMMIMIMMTVMMMVVEVVVVARETIYLGFRLDLLDTSSLLPQHQPNQC